jgi:hypothetical protein
MFNVPLVEYDPQRARENEVNANISEAIVVQVAVDAVKKRKNMEKVEVTIVEHSQEDWVVRGTCPIDMEGHPWAEKFEVVLDPKGKVKSLDLALL